MGVKNQSKEEIYTTILENIRNINNVPLVTRIMYVSLHSHRQLKGYLAHMIENDLLKYNGQKHVYEVTSKGKQFLVLSKHLSQLLSPEKYGWSLNPMSLTRYRKINFTTIALDDNCLAIKNKWKLSFNTSNRIWKSFAL